MKIYEVDIKDAIFLITSFKSVIFLSSQTKPYVKKERDLVTKSLTFDPCKPCLVVISKSPRLSSDCNCDKIYLSIPMELCSRHKKQINLKKRKRKTNGTIPVTRD